MTPTSTALRAFSARSNTFLSILFGQTVNTARWLLPAILLLGGGLSAFLLKADRPVVAVSVTRIRQPLSTLEGKPAVASLKAHGLYDRLRNAAKEGTTDRTKNPAQHPHASFSGERMLPEPVQRRGRRHWQTGLKLRGVRYGAQPNAATTNRIFTEVKELTASNAAANDSFGFTVAVSGDTIVVGAYNKNSQAGEAYIYQRNQGGADNWGEVKKLIPSDAGADSRFGSAVAISADIIVVGAQLKNARAGVAYIFARNQGGPDNWGEVKKLVASDTMANDFFGTSVGISAGTVLIGAHGSNGTLVGAAYIFERNQGGADNWGQVKKLTASDGGSFFGYASAISGDTVIVGALGKNSNTGAAYLYERNQGGANNWGETRILTASDGAAQARFGGSVTILADTVAIGAWGKNSFAGGAYIYARNQGGADNWGEVKKLIPSDATANSYFGESVGINGDLVVVGADGNNSDTGAAYLYHRNQGGADNWGEVQKLTASDAAASDSFGASVAISDATIVSGAYGKNSRTGAAYVFAPKRRAVKADFDGDCKTDLAVWRGNLLPAPWLILQSSNNSLQSIDWGTAQAPVNDEIVPGDYDGDGKTDVAVFRRSNGRWYIQRSSDGGTTDEFWGLGTDAPVPGDYDGDGKTDVAVFRVSANAWYIKQSSDGMTKSETWGTVGDTPVPGDYDGDGKTDVAVWRGAVGGWYIKQSSDGMIKSETWGTSAAPHFDVPVPADYDGDGKYDVAVWRGPMTNWHILKSSDGQTQSVSWGTSAAPYFDVPVPGDYDGDGKADVAVWRPLDGNWLVIRSSDGTNLIQQHGQSGDTPVPSKGAH